MVSKAVLDSINKDFGTGTAVVLSDNTITAVDRLPTGALTLDLALGGGLPRGVIIEAYGAESSGKTTIALHAIAEAQAANIGCAFIDAEFSFDPVYAKAIGVTDDLIFVQPNSGEDALAVALRLIETGEVGFIVIDSVASLVPRAELNGDIGDAFIGLQARMMSQALRKLAGPASRFNTTLFFINQLREKVGVMFGNPITTPGGRALKFYSSVRLEVTKRDAIKDGTEVTGNLTTVKVVKNKTAPPLKVAEFDIVYGTGISKEGCVLDMALELGFLKKKGSWIATIPEDENIGQGRAAAKEYLKENPAFMAGLSEAITDYLS